MNSAIMLILRIYSRYKVPELKVVTFKFLLKHVHTYFDHFGVLKYFQMSKKYCKKE